MKAIIILLFCFIFVGCLAHWENPSSKLADQADNYLTHDRDLFFYRLCSLTGDANNCVTDKGFVPECQESFVNWVAWVDSNMENLKRYDSSKNNDYVFVRETEKKIQRMIQEDDKEGVKTLMIELLQKLIDSVTENEWEQCAEVANVK